MSEEKISILHVCARTMILPLRDEILRRQGYEVSSTLSLDEASAISRDKVFSLVLIDVEGDGRVAQAEQLCDEIRKHRPEALVAFVCNHRASIQSDCPDELIRAQFDPREMVRSVRELLDHRHV